MERGSERAREREEERKKKGFGKQSLTNKIQITFSFSNINHHIHDDDDDDEDVVVFFLSVCPFNVKAFKHSIYRPPPVNGSLSGHNTGVQTLLQL